MQVWIDRQDLIHTRSTMPRGIVNCDNDLRVNAHWIRTHNIPKMHDKSHLQPLRFTVPGLCLAVGWLVEQARCSGPRHEIEGCKTIHLVLIIPHPHQGPLALPTRQSLMWRLSLHVLCHPTWRPPLCGPSNSTFPIRHSPPWIASSNRPRRPVSSAGCVFHGFLPPSPSERWFLANL